MEYNPKIVEACPFNYYWSIKFKDGEVISQYDQEGNEVLYQKVLDKIDSGIPATLLQLLPLRECLYTYTQKLDPLWQRPIVFRRRRVNLGAYANAALPLQTIMAIGWQATIEGRNIKSILYVDEEDNIVISSE